MRLTSKEVTKAIQVYARRHNYYARTVRAVTSLKMEAIQEWREDQAAKAFKGITVTINVIDGNPQGLTAVAVVEKRDSLSWPTFIVHVKWVGIELDRPCTFAWSTGIDSKLADRLAACVNSQKAFTNIRLARDVSGKTYVACDALIMGKYMERDLTKLGF